MSLDHAVLRVIVSNVECWHTLASLACASQFLRQAVGEELARRGGVCKHCRSLTGIQASTSSGLQRCTVALQAAWRRQLLLDITAAECRGQAWEGDRLSWDLSDLTADLLRDVHLLVTDGHHYVTLYSLRAQLLGALVFQQSSGIHTPRLFYSKVAALLLKCPLSLGIIQLEPPVHRSARHYLQGPAAAACSSGSKTRRARRAAVDDDFHLLRPALLHQRHLQHCTMLAGSLWGTMDAALIEQLRPPLKLRLLDVSGNASLPDASLARLLALCPELRVLRTAGSCFGAASLDVLCGRQLLAVEASTSSAPLQPQQQQQQQRPQPPACPNLEQLDLSRCQVSLTDLFAALTSLSRLDTLTANGLAGSRDSCSSDLALDCSLAGRLTALCLLDVDMLSPGDAASLLRACTRLRRLAVSGRRLAAERFHQQPWDAADETLPDLHQLSVGWGTGGQFLASALSGSPYLSSLTVHLGAEASNWHLQHAAASCRHLRRLRLVAANVSDAGLSAVLQGCTQLTSLELLHCQGPVTDACTLGLQDRHPAFRLKHLALAWSGGGRQQQLTDTGLGRLLHPAVASLRSIVLAGLCCLSDPALTTLAQHSSTLECIQLEACGSLEHVRKAGGPVEGLPPPISGQAVERLVQRCGQLVAVTISKTVADKA